MAHTSKRPLVTQYNRGDEMVKINRSANVDTAIMACVGHLQTDEYGATYAIIYDPDRGLDHAIFTRTPNQINVLYKRKVKSREQ